MYDRLGMFRSSAGIERAFSSRLNMPDKETSATANSGRQGLTDEQASQRLAAEGANTLPGRSRRKPLRLLLEVLREPMLALLLAAGVV